MPTDSPYSTPVRNKNGILSKSLIETDTYFVWGTQFQVDLQYLNSLKDNIYVRWTFS